MQFRHPLCTKPNTHITGNFYPAIRLIWIQYKGNKYGVNVDSEMTIINQFDLYEIAKTKYQKMSSIEKERNPLPEYNPYNVLQNGGRDKELKRVCEWIGEASIKYAADMVYCYYPGNTYGVVPYKYDHIYNQYEMGRIHSAMRQNMLVEKKPKNEIAQVPYYRATRYDAGYARFKRVCEYMGGKYLGVLKVTYQVHPRDNSLTRNYANDVVEARALAKVA